jgi:quinol-cytochrome oxidoreductase complex cytochrome b subunit/coenzyme F420-reducing hydrogenase delta subunit
LLKTIRHPLRTLLLHVEAVFDRAFGPHWNPIRQLGTLAFFLFWVCAVSGIYVFILFETTVAGAFASVEYMTREQWYLGGIMRSLHRYSSDAMVVVMVLHMGREFVLDRYRGARWFSWLIGVPTIWFLYMSGISGYWLVWDQLAQYVAIASMEWLDWLGIFGEPVATNFLTPDSLSDRFFSLLVFIHIFVPLFLLFTMWIHVLRVTQPKINPPRGLAAGTLVMLVALSLVWPAVSHEPADLAVVPASLNLDWFYLPFYLLFDAWGGRTLWGLAVGVSVLLAAMPWLPPLRRSKAARVALDKCNGCRRCFADCPFGAITMEARSDSLPFEQEAVVDTDACARCGICVGACPVSTPFQRAGGLVTAIDLPDFALGHVRDLTERGLRALASEPADGGRRVMVFGCDHGARVGDLEQSGVAVVSLPCIGMLPPSFIDYALSRGAADGVVITGCRDGGCYQRFGVRWTQERLEGMRDPYLRSRVPRQRIRTLWAAPTDAAKLEEEVQTFRFWLRGLEDDHSPPPPEAALAPESVE